MAAFNFSCFERGNESETGRVHLQTSTTEPNISMTHPVNTSDNPQAFTATMYKKGGITASAASLQVQSLLDTPTGLLTTVSQAVK